MVTNLVVNTKKWKLASVFTSVNYTVQLINWSMLANLRLSETVNIIVHIPHLL